MADSAHVASLSVSNSTARALQFFSDHASGTTFEDEAINASRHYRHPAEPFEKIAFQLEEWATYQESGMANLKPFDVRFRIEAATDIMEQVHLLLKDPELHPAAAVVLAGAALEEFLRSMQFDCGEPIKGKPGISVYAEALRFTRCVHLRPLGSPLAPRTHPSSASLPHSGPWVPSRCPRPGAGHF